MKRILILVVSIIALVLCLSIVSSAEDVIRRGVWRNLNWELNETTGELTISGEGIMDEFRQNSNNAWLAYKDKIKTVKIEEGITRVGFRAFENCTNLVSVDIPDSMENSFCEEAFYGCVSLENINIKDSNPWFTTVDGVVYSKDKKTLICYPKGKTATEFTIPDTVLYIGMSAFYESAHLESITIPDSVERIDFFAFSYCTGLVNIVIPDSVTGLSNAFPGCTSLESVKLPDNITSIDSSMFYGCSSLKSITIPKGVTRIGHEAFFGCESLTSIEIPDSVTEIGSFAFADCKSLTSIEIPDGVTTINSRTFSGCSSLTNIKIPDNVTDIKREAFLGCESLVSIEIPDGVTSINESTFAECKSLESVKLSDAVTSIGKNAFSGCEGLVSMEIPNAVTSIDDNAFSDCDNLKLVIIKSDAIVSQILKTNSCGKLIINAISVIVPNGSEVSVYFANKYTGIENISIDGAEYTVYSDHDHTWEVLEILKQPTKKEEGEQRVVCTDCSVEKTEAIPMLEGCFGGGGVTAAFISSGGISLVWFALKRKKI